jgi:phosphopantothenate synthetase
MAEAEISVFTISTFDTDWILVPVSDADRAAEMWREGGHEVVVATPVRPEREARATSQQSRTKPKESNDR